MGALRIVWTSPDDVYEFPIRIPRDMDLPFSVQLYDGRPGCSIPEPHNVAGHEFVLEVFKDKFALEPLLEFPNEDWTREQSPDQEGDPVDDIVKRIFLWEEWDVGTILKTGIEYWFRFRGRDAEGTDFIIGRGTLKLGRY